MTELFDAVQRRNLERVRLLVEQGTDKNQIGGEFEETALSVAAYTDNLDVVRFLVEQGADMEKVDKYGWTPLINASSHGHLDVARYLLEQGANRDKANNNGYTSLHFAALGGHLETAKLLMVYGADLNARTSSGKLPVDVARTEEIKQAIRDEPRRRMDHGHKRATEQDRHPNALASTSAEQEEEEDGDDQISKKPRLDEGEVEAEGKVAEEDEPSEPSDEEDD